MDLNNWQRSLSSGKRHQQKKRNQEREMENLGNTNHRLQIPFDNLFESCERGHVRQQPEASRQSDASPASRSSVSERVPMIAEYHQNVPETDCNYLVTRLVKLRECLKHATKASEKYSRRLDSHGIEQFGKLSLLVRQLKEEEDHCLLSLQKSLASREMSRQKQLREEQEEDVDSDDMENDEEMDRRQELDPKREQDCDSSCSETELLTVGEKQLNKGSAQGFQRQSIIFRTLQDQEGELKKRAVDARSASVEKDAEKRNNEPFRFSSLSDSQLGDGQMGGCRSVVSSSGRPPESEHSRLTHPKSRYVQNLNEVNQKDGDETFDCSGDRCGSLPGTLSHLETRCLEKKLKGLDEKKKKMNEMLKKLQLLRQERLILNNELKEAEMRNIADVSSLTNAGHLLNECSQQPLEAAERQETETQELLHGLKRLLSLDELPPFDVPPYLLKKLTLDRNSTSPSFPERKDPNSKENPIDPLSDYYRKRSEMAELIEERKCLLEIQEHLGRIQDAIPEDLPDEDLFRNFATSTLDGEPFSSAPVADDVSSAGVGQDLASGFNVKHVLLDPKSAEPIQVKFQNPLETVISNEELYDRMRQQRILREELLEKRKAQKENMPENKPNDSKIQNRPVQSMQFSVASNKSDLGRISPSEDVTGAATWGGSTAANIEEEEECDRLVPEDQEDKQVQCFLHQNFSTHLQALQEKNTASHSSLYARSYHDDKIDTNSKDSEDDERANELTALRNEMKSMKKMVASLALNLTGRFSLEEELQLQKNHAFLGLNQCFFQLLSTQNAMMARLCRLEKHCLVNAASGDTTTQVAQNCHHGQRRDTVGDGCGHAGMLCGQCHQQIAVAGNSSCEISDRQSLNVTNRSNHRNRLRMCRKYSSKAHRESRTVSCLKDGVDTGGSLQVRLDKAHDSNLSDDVSLFQSTRSRNQSKVDSARTLDVGREKLVNSKLVQHFQRKVSGSLGNSPSNSSDEFILSSSVPGTIRPRHAITELYSVKTEAGANNHSFEFLRETIYSEVEALVALNEHCPHYLIRLFQELQLLSTDSLRQMALHAIQDISAKSSVPSTTTGQQENSAAEKISEHNPILNLKTSEFAKTVGDANSDDAEAAESSSLESFPDLNLSFHSQNSPEDYAANDRKFSNASLRRCEESSGHGLAIRLLNGIVADDDTGSDNADEARHVLRDIRTDDCWQQPNHLLRDSSDNGTCSQISDDSRECDEEISNIVSKHKAEEESRQFKDEDRRDVGDDDEEVRAFNQGFEGNEFEVSAGRWVNESDDVFNRVQLHSGEAEDRGFGRPREERQGATERQQNSNA